jgi:eukaryotic-like serine/threonine-protein kinase
VGLTWLQLNHPAIRSAFGESLVALASGTRLGHYEIISSIATGGMGEVYKARDSRLNRTVAIKILRQNLSELPELKERFRREAQAIANLNHPNICVIHDIGYQDGLDYLVMEHLRGETFAQRVGRGPLTVDEVMKFAIEISDALDKVHEQGVVHRDLKPSNIMMTRSGIKLLDFGLAKLLPAKNLELTVTESGVTAEGTILGTLHYMAPEQVQGKEADARSDIFSVGAILYELLTGKRAFEGKSAASVIGAVLEREPEAISLRDRKSKGLDYVIRRCIAKNPADRWQSAHDLLLHLRWIVRDDADGIAQPARSVTLVWSVLLIAALIAIFALMLVMRRNPEPAQAALTRFELYPPQGRTFTSPANISPDGRTLAFVARNESGERLIWLRSLDNLQAKPLPGTEEIVPPFFWSPDSQHIGFFTASHLKKIALPDGPAQTLAEVQPYASGASGGGAWGDGTILFVPAAGQPLFQIPAGGGASSAVTTLSENLEEIGHDWPYFLSDGKHFLYVARSRNPEKTGVYAGVLGSNNRKRILDGNTVEAFSPPGYLLFMRGKNLFAQPFDETRLELSGNPTALASRLDAIGAYSVSRNGVLTVQAEPAQLQTQLLWFDRKGEQVASSGPPDIFYNAVLSPDGREIAVERLGQQENIWLVVQRDRLVRFTVEGPYDQTPVWSRDGKFIAFTTELSPKGWIIRRRGTGGQVEIEDLATFKGESYTTDWSPDGQFIAIETFDRETRWDCWLLPTTGNRTPRPLLNTSFNEGQLQFSPDGQWIAYTSNLSGRNEVYVQRFPTSGAPLPISTNGGMQPRWRRDGHELFYIAPDQKLMSVDIRVSPTFEAGSPKELFQLHVDRSQEGVRNYYDVSADGQRFLVNTVVKEPTRAVTTVLLNWTAALKQP